MRCISGSILTVAIFTCVGCSGADRRQTTNGSSNGAGGDLASSGVDLQSLDDGSTNAYGDLGRTDSGICQPGQTASSCPSPLPSNGCGNMELCGADGSGNGLDDNCNGQVDEGCTCTPGQVQKCFVGPPAMRNVGACQDGTQTCGGASEFPSWGSCIGSIGPAPEICDQVDNDCNGCADDGLCCGTLLSCPSPGDPRIPPALPYTDVALKGELFFSGAAASWSWTIVGGPCDQLFATTTGTPPTQSFTLTGATAKDATAHFTLSGDYTVTMTATASDGTKYTCTWIQHIVGPGVRFELCWDHTGSAPGGADLDLHVHRAGTTTQWFADSSGTTSTDDCYYTDCNPNSYLFCGGTFLPACTGVPSWGYNASPIMQCSGAPGTTPLNATWAGDPPDDCPNPRLDIDNISVVGKPENTNIDNPKNNDSFRAMVHYFGQGGDVSSADVAEHPIVNIYCGGNLKASYGTAPNQLSGFTHGYGLPDTTMPSPQAQIWRVADVKAIVDGMGNTTDCTVDAIHPPLTMSGYYITNAGVGY